MINRKSLFLLSVLAGSLQAVSAFEVKTFWHVGPIAVRHPLLMDSVNVNGMKFQTEQLLDLPVAVDRAAKGAVYSGALSPAGDDEQALHLLQFRLQSRGYVPGQIRVAGLKHARVLVDGVDAGCVPVFKPGTHQVVIKYLAQRGQRDSLRVSVEAAKEALLSADTDDSNSYTLRDVLEGKRVYSVYLSATGSHLITAYSITQPGGKTSYQWRLSETATGRVLRQSASVMKWMPDGRAYCTTEEENGGQTVLVTDVATGHQRTLARNLPAGASFMVSPKADYLLVSVETEGTKEDSEIYQVVEPEDRIPGWRNRVALYVYRIATGLLQPLTFGSKGVALQDISADGRYVLAMTSRSRLTQRPTTLNTLVRIDLQTLQLESLVVDDGFLAAARFSPDGCRLVLMGSPECLGGVGKNLPDGRIPSMYDYQLYTFDIASHKVTPLTRTFNPSVEQFAWSQADGRIYFTALDKDCRHLFRTTAEEGRIEQIAVPEDMVNRFSLPRQGTALAWFGESASNSYRVYLLDTKTRKSKLVDDLSSDILRHVKLGKCEAWDFVNSRGDTINGRFYLPADFDPAKKYPLIVNYYGGCVPTSRTFESRYPQHLYAAMGYVIYVVNPSGAAGFGQEFASRHVNTAGEGVADDIIEGTRKFCAAHRFVDSTKIGCIGASYGGFMTQYLQTRTNLFAAAISHAGISDHTSYWGEGYWGYSYSEVSMAGRYPWTDHKLFVEHSPLFQVEKIHTPLLFLHGTADHNVPVGESIQMFNALKLLGRETALVLVDGQDHHITDYSKRVKWQDTIFAWFAKYLQGDADWWNALYEKVK